MNEPTNGGKTMREIKFRAWDNQSKRMINVQRMIATRIGCLVSEYLQGEDGDYISDYELMQYTGLKDKNGREIYEGDIVSMMPEGYASIPAEVRITERGVMFHRLDGDYPDLLVADWEGAIVIGNIYENPELLKGNSNERADK